MDNFFYSYQGNWPLIKEVRHFLLSQQASFKQALQIFSRLVFLTPAKIISKELTSSYLIHMVCCIINKIIN